MKKVNVDCRHFGAYVPCKPHKAEGVHSEGCKYYDKIDFKILIIKLDAVGDVLRTTSVLHGLKEKYTNTHITWLTRDDALPLFRNNRLVDTVLDFSKESFLRIQSETYDLVFNPDASANSAILASLTKAKVKKGFGYNERGYVYPFNKEAEKWFEMGLFDDIKKANKNTYQEIMNYMVGIRPSSYDIIFKLDEGGRAFAKAFAETHGVSRKNLLIGLNTGTGARWQNKKWPLQGYLGLIRMIR